MERVRDIAVIGGGVTGLAVGCATGAPVYERGDQAGGLCRSYALRAGDSSPSSVRHDDAYRFEIGGGHWIFGGNDPTIDWLSELVPLRTYVRRADVRMPESGVSVPYPLQAHLEQLGPDVAREIGREMEERTESLDRARDTTFHEWLLDHFGPTLCRLFFHPFNDRYTAGLTQFIAPQDGFKSPVAPPSGNRSTPPPGYNSTFRYPEGGLDVLTDRMADRCDVRYRSSVVGIDADKRELRLADGAIVRYRHLVSTLPLHQALSMTGIDAGEAPDPYTSVLVLNIGALRGATCPDCHWLYDPGALRGFHRIGFYSNVEPEFLPAAHREDGSRVALYVERSFAGGARPSTAAVDAYARTVVEELQSRGTIGAVEALHPSWVDVAYTWQRVGSSWRERAIEALSARGIEQVGRYGRWHFQGIAESIAEGLAAGRALAAGSSPTLG